MWVPKGENGWETTEKRQRTVVKRLVKQRKRLSLARKSFKKRENIKRKLEAGYIYRKRAFSGQNRRVGNSTYGALLHWVKIRPPKQSHSTLLFNRLQRPRFMLKFKWSILIVYQNKEKAVILVKQSIPYEFNSVFNRKRKTFVRSKKVIWLLPTANRPFHRCWLRTLAFEWTWGWGWPCFFFLHFPFLIEILLKNAG